MTTPSLDYLHATYRPRFFAEGVHYRDLDEIRARVTTVADWCPVWSEFARAAEERADRALTAGARVTAGTELARASLYFFFGQFMLFDDPARKRIAYEDCARTFRRAAEHLDPPLEPVDVPYRGLALPGYLRRPTGVAKPPCVVLLGGLDTTKEEQLVISTLCAQRGLATFTFDGPGQGETYAKMKLVPDFDRAVAAALDVLDRRDDVDPGRIGVIGRSMGGHWAPKMAAVDRRVKAAVAWGAMYDLRNWATMPEFTQRGFVYATGSRSLEDAKPFFDAIDLRGLTSRITCPLMIVHGGLDRITPMDNATRMAAEARGPVEVLAWDDSVHCAHDRAHICRPAMADFMLRWL